MAFMIRVPPLAMYLNNLPVGAGMRALNRSKETRKCANPNCKARLTKEQVKRGYKFHDRACGRIVVRNLNARGNYVKE
jgi:hypothetical protein